jgi:sugar-specific transcriptional regulator TrmB
MTGKDAAPSLDKTISVTATPCTDKRFRNLSYSMEDLEEVLEDLGLSDSEIKLYTRLLREGEGTASGIAKKSGVNRRLAYDQFENLQQKGLVSYVDQDDKRIYKPANPERLKELVEDRRSELNELENEVESVIPEALKHFNSEKHDREVRVMTGKEAIKRLFNDELREGETIHLIGSPEKSEEVLEYFLPTWTDKRVEKDILIKGVFEHSMRGMVGEHGPLEDRYLPEGEESKVSIAVYGDKVGIIFWIENPLVLMIEDSDAAESFMTYFHLVWEAAEP